jgi:hypothetical protein
MSACLDRCSAAGLALGLAILAAGLSATAFVPVADRIAKAMAVANSASGRAHALQLDITLRVADREPIGTGKLLTHPHGLARLELRDAAGRVERHIRVVAEHAASRSGREIEAPRAFLPPLSFLQVDSSDTLLQAFSDYGLDAGAAALAPCGQSICYVLGDPARVPPAPPAEDDDDPESDAELGGITFSDPDPLARSERVPSGRESAAPVAASVWVDSHSFEIIRIESSRGVRFDLGPLVDFEGIRFPGSITIHEPEREPVRFDVLGVVAVNAPAAAFSRRWLLAPPDSEAPSEDQSERAEDRFDRPPTSPAAR